MLTGVTVELVAYIPQIAGPTNHFCRRRIELYMRTGMDHFPAYKRIFITKSSQLFV